MRLFLQLNWKKGDLRISVLMCRCAIQLAWQSDANHLFQVLLEALLFGRETRLVTCPFKGHFRHSSSKRFSCLESFS
jgi:hypothetical protein